MNAKELTSKILQLCLEYQASQHLNAPPFADALQSLLESALGEADANGWDAGAVEGQDKGFKRGQAAAFEEAAGIAEQHVTICEGDGECQSIADAIRAKAKEVGEGGA